MAKALNSKQRDNHKGGILKGIAKALLLISLAAGAFYFGWHLFTMRNSQTIVCLTMLSEEGLFIYRYQSPERRPDTGSDNGTGANGDDTGDVPNSDSDWAYVGFGRKVRLTGVSGKPVSLGEIYSGPLDKAVVELVIGPDGKIAKISETLEGFAVKGEVEGTESGIVTISGKEYVFDEEASFDGEQGDLVEVYGFDESIIYAEVLEKAGTLQIASDVEGARIFLDGVYKGQSPLTVNTVPGLKEIMVKSPGYKTTRTQAMVESRQVSQVLVDLPLVVGTVEVTSTPSDACVFINQEPMGTTPASIQLPPGDYDVLVEKPGYYSRRSRLKLVQDTLAPLHFNLAAEASGASPIGDLTSGLVPPDSQAPGTRMTVLSYDPDSRILEAMDSNRGLLSLTVPREVALETLPSGRTSWDRLLPGEEVVVMASPSGYIEKATKVYSHGFSAGGKVFASDGRVITVGDNWARCTLNPDVLIQHQPGNTFAGSVDTGDTVTAYGASADNIKYVLIEEPLGTKSPFEGYLVKTDDGPRIFSDGALLPLSVPGNIDVVDAERHVKDKISAVPSGSKIQFYANPEGSIVWAEYIWKANVSVEGRIALMSGPVISILPSWEEATISLNTAVFLGRDRRPFYDIKPGDTVLVAGPSQVDTRFIWIKNRISFESVVEGFMGAGDGRQTRIFNELGRSGQITQWVVDTNVTFVDPKQKKSLSSNQVNHGDKVRLWLAAGGKPVWGEVIERNEINLSGHYLGEHKGLWYFTGFEGFVPAGNLILTGLFKDEELQKGSRVHVGGHGQYINYVEVQELAEIVRWINGTVVSIEKNVIGIMRSRYSITEYGLPNDIWYVDWEAGVDGNARNLNTGDEVRIGLGYGRQAAFIERSHSPRFKVEGTVTAVSGRNLTISGEYGTLRAVIQSNAFICRNGEIAGYWEIQPGDRVHLAGSSADLIELVVGTS